MYALLFRTVIIYFGVLVALRLMGKRQLGEMQPAELVSTVLISNLASLSIESADAPLWSSLVPLFLITVTEIIDSILVMKFPAYARLVLGNPKVIIQNGVIDQSVLSELRLRIEDVFEALRGQEIFDIRDVCYAVVEPNGTIHAAKYPNKESVTKEDLALPEDKQTPVLPLWMDGQCIAQNLTCCGKDSTWMENEIEKNQIDPKQLLAVLGDENGACVWIKKQGHNNVCPPEDTL